MSVEPSRRSCEAMLWLILLFAPAAFGSTEWWSRAVLESLIFSLAALCALRRDFSAPAGAPLYGFALVLIMGALQFVSVRPLAGPATLLPFTVSRPQTLYALLLWSSYASLLWAASGILRWEGALRRVFWAIFVIGLFIAVTGILQRGQGNAAYYGLRPIRHGLPFGPFTNCDHAASWMVASIFAGIGLFAEGFRRSRAPLTERVAKQILIVFALIVQLGAVWETASRGAINAFLVSALVTSYLAAGAMTGAIPRRLSRAGLVLAGCVYGVFIYFNPKSLGFVGGALDTSTAYRVSMYRSGLGMLTDFPFFGVGLGGFTSAFPAYQESLVVGLVEHVHSSWLEVALETGLLGVSAFALVLLAPLFKLGRHLSTSEISSGATTAGCFAALFSFLLHGVVEFNFQIPANAILFIVFSAATLMIRPPSLKLASSAVQRPGAVLAGAFLILSLLSLPAGFTGVTPRYGAPFMSSNDTLLPHFSGEPKLKP